MIRLDPGTWTSLSGDQPFSGVIAIAFLVFAALTITYVIWRKALKEKRQKTAAGGGNMEMPRPTERLLDNPDFESIPVPSITEDTTEFRLPYLLELGGRHLTQPKAP
ncbi:hypothetical protein BH20ACI2_BH20ACI2_05200 [soil metagenome]